jgi:hypothetical protein
MKEEEFNGWTNRETWATMLHIDNDQGLLETAIGYAREQVENHEESEEINPYYLGELIREWIEDEVLIYENIQTTHATYLMLTDIGSLYRVNWREIADTLISYAKEGANV